MRNLALVPRLAQCISLSIVAPPTRQQTVWQARNLYTTTPPTVPTAQNPPSDSSLSVSTSLDSPPPLRAASTVCEPSSNHTQFPTRTSISIPTQPTVSRVSVTQSAVPQSDPIAPVDPPTQPTVRDDSTRREASGPPKQSPNESPAAARYVFELDFVPSGASDPAAVFTQLQTSTSEPLPSDAILSSLAYKKVANKIRPVAATLPEEFRIVRRSPPDPLKDMPELPTHPPDFVPSDRLTQERYDALELHQSEFLWPEEKKLLAEVVRLQEKAFAWNEDEKGTFSDEYFDPIQFPTVEHVPWVLRNIPIPPGIYDQVIETVKDKIRSGTYEPSNSSYRSRWFWVLKKDGKSLRLVHDLQPLNAVTIRDPALPPHSEQLAESFSIGFFAFVGIGPPLYLLFSCLRF